MNVREYQIKIKLTRKLAPLEEIAYNLWWCWNTRAMTLFESINPEVWESSSHSPIEVLASLTKSDCERLENDSLFMARLKHVYDVFKEYMNSPKWYDSHKNAEEDFQVAYFSFEYGLHESVPLYSGGLGILSGDHCKSASDVGIPFVAVGLLYRSGYFHQYTNSDGWQQERYGYNEFHKMPIKPAVDENGNEVYVTVPMVGRDMKIKVWKLTIGRICIVLLDTDLIENTEEERQISSRLYAGDSTMRIRQEVVLGIGGIRALDACGYKPTVYHLNEGHPAFAGFERFNQMIRAGIPHNKAMEIIKKSTLFTTHTPVPAGFDVFSVDQIRNYIEPLFHGTNINLNQIMAIGRGSPFDSEPFNMAIAGIRMSTFRNGVSKLHGEVSRKMFNFMWPQALQSQVPIGHVTNGVHLPTFISSDFKHVFYQYLTDRWHTSPHDLKVWKNIQDIPSGLIHETKRLLREKLISFARKRMKENLRQKGVSAAELMEVDEILRPDVLTIGFARRFATYKRATLIFSDEERLRKILLNPERPVQMIFAGKAHPRDNEGKEFIKKIIHIARKPEFSKNIIFIEDYDIEVGKHLTAGVDIWLNNPRRPQEASGTSGMKAAANGALNFSVLDGWWVEGYNGQNGFAVGAGEDYTDTEYQDYVEYHDIYNKLENEIVPLFYTKDRTGLPQGWLQMVKNTMSTVPAFFNTTRMLMEYTDKYYIPLHYLHTEFVQGTNAEDYLKWWDNMIYNWDNLSIYDCSVDTKDFSLGEKVAGIAHVHTGNLTTDDIGVYTVLEYNGESGKFANPLFIPMEVDKKLDDGNVRYKSTFNFSKAGKAKFAFAVVPANKFISNMFEANKIKWG